MKRIAIILFLFISTYVSIFGSPQAPEFIVIGKDTFAIYQLPIIGLKDRMERKLYRMLWKEGNIDKYEIPHGLARGYRALWEIVDNKLYLIKILNISDSDSDIVLRKTFGKKFQSGKVHADWFTGDIAVSKDKLLRWDGIFSRTHMSEDIYQFINGNLVNKEFVNNYIDLPNGINRINDNPYEFTYTEIVDTIFHFIKQLDWTTLSEINDCGCDDSYEITIDENGKIGDIELIPFHDTPEERLADIKDHEECIRQFKAKLNHLQFDIIKWNGRPYKEKIPFDIFYTVDGELENCTYH